MDALQEKRIKQYWQNFQDSLPPDSVYRERPFSAESWGDGPELADELGRLIAAGVKTATCSAVWEWQAEENPWPEPGFITIVLDGGGQPLCIVETTEITIKPYHQVDAGFASEEGEGDLSLAYWRTAHRNYFSRTLQKIGRQFSEDMPLVCERFQLIYK